MSDYNKLDENLIKSDNETNTTSTKKQYKKLGEEMTEEEEAEILEKIGGPIQNSFTDVNIFSKILFLWPVKIIEICKNLPLKAEYLGKLDYSYSAEAFAKNGTEYWNNNKGKYSLIRCLFNLNWGRLLVFSLMSILITFMSLANIILIKNLINYFSTNPDKEPLLFGWGLYEFGGIYIGFKLLILFLSKHGYFIEYILSYKAGMELTAIIYDKIISTSLSGKKKLASEGEIVNYIQIDCYKVISTISMSPQLITNPIQVIVFNYLLFAFFSWYYLVGLGTLLFFFFINFYIFKGYRINEEKYLTAKDDRMKITNQVFNHLKIIKFNSWIEEFRDKVEVKREKEMEAGKNLLDLSIWNIFLFWTSPIISNVLTIGFYFYFTQNLDPSIIFTSITIFAGIQNPLREIPSSINSLIDLFISMKRIENFLSQPDKSEDDIKDFSYISPIDKSINDSKENEKLSIRLKNCNFSWGNKDDSANANDEPQYRVLKNINLEVKKGEFIGIIGEVGSGKSTFLNLLLNNLMKLNEGEKITDKPKKLTTEETTEKSLKKSFLSNNEQKLDKSFIESNNFSESNDLLISNKTTIVESSLANDNKSVYSDKNGGEFKIINKKENEEQNLIQIRGSISYVPQVAWIQNATLRENILLFKPYDKEKFKKIEELCELKADLKILSAGDMTEIGEKGINLSGGQKMRVSLARAIYCDSDIYLLDDPLAALDGNVGQNIFHNLLKNHLNNKTRILVTNNINYLEFLDRIILLKEGRIIFEGSYDEFKNNNVFNEYESFLKKNKDESDNEHNHVKKEEDEITIKIEKIVSHDGNEEMRRKEEEENQRKIELDKEKINKLIQNEDKEVGEVKMSVYKDYIEYMGGTGWFIFILVIMILWQCFKIGGDLWMTLWMDKTVFDNAYINFGIYAGLLLFSNVFIYIRLKILVNGTFRMCNRLHTEMLGALAHAPINLYHDIEPKGRILNRMSKDLEYIIYIMFSIGTVLANLLGLIGVIGLTSYYIYYLLFFIPIIAIIGTYLTNNYLYPSRELSRMTSVTQSKILNIVSESLPGMSIILCNKKTDNYKAYLYKTMSTILNFEYFYTGIYLWFGFYLDFISFLFTGALVGYIMIFPQNFNEITAGILFAYVNNLTDSLFLSLSSVSSLENNMVSFERCISYTKVIQEKEIMKESDRLNMEEEYNKIFMTNKEKEKLKNSKNKVHDKDDITLNTISMDNSNITQNQDSISIINNETVTLVDEKWPQLGTITFCNYSVKYRPNTPIVLKNLNISINDGEKIGVVGRTGSGKSTLCLSLFRILEASNGCILIDNQDISKIPLNILRYS